MDNPPRLRGTSPDRASTRAFRSFFDRTYGPATSYLRRRMWSDASYEDAVADAYAVVWRRWDDRPEDPDAWMPWMYGICRNVLRNHRRSSVRRDRLQRRVEREPAAPTHEGADLDVPLHEAMATLAEVDREVLRLSTWEGLSHAEIGVVMGCSANAVAIRSHRARRQLAALLGGSERTHERTDMEPVTRTLPCELNPMENPA